MKNMTYEEAIKKLETLAQRMEQAEVPIDEIAAQLQEAQKLIKYCRERLTKAEEAVQQILEAR